MSDFTLGAYWGARQERVDSCARRFELWKNYLLHCTPHYHHWFEQAYSREKALEVELDLSGVETIGNNFDSDAIFENLGYGFSAWNGANEGQDECSMSVRCGLYSNNANLSNSAVLDIPRSVYRYPEKTRLLLLKTVEAWEPDWAAIYSNGYLTSVLFQETGKRPLFIDWMLYLKDVSAIDLSLVQQWASYTKTGVNSAIFVLRPQSFETEEDKVKRTMFAEAIY